MSKAEITLLIFGGLLLVLTAILLVRIGQLRRQIRSFTARIKERRADDMNQPVSVDYFQKDIIGLANELNAYTTLIKEEVSALQNDRKQLKNIIAGISHDFRTPLTSIKGYLQLLEKSGCLDEKETEYLKIALQKTDYLKSLSDAFFEVSSLEAKTEVVEKEKVNLITFLSELVLGQFDWINAKGLETDINIPEKDLYVLSNKELLNRIFENFFSNMKKYSDKFISLSVDEEGENVIVSLKNDMAYDTDLDVNKVFEAFYRESSRSSEGSGIGLYVVDCLARSLGHKVWADLQDGVFAIYLEIKTSDIDYRE